MSRKNPTRLEFEVRTNERGWEVRCLNSKRQAIRQFSHQYTLCRDSEDPGAFVDADSGWRVFHPSVGIRGEVRESNYHDAVVTDWAERPDCDWIGMQSLYTRSADHPATDHWSEVARVYWHEEGVSIHMGEWESLPVAATCALGRALSGRMARDFLMMSSVALARFPRGSSFKAKPKQDDSAQGRGGAL